MNQPIIKIGTVVKLYLILKIKLVVMLIEVIGHEKLLMQFSGFDYTIALEICTKNPNGVFMKYLLKCFALFIIKFEYKITVRGYHLVDFVVNCSNCKHVVCCKKKMEGISIIS